jgi:hypothetical protein
MASSCGDTEIKPVHAASCYMLKRRNARRVFSVRAHPVKPVSTSPVTVSQRDHTGVAADLSHCTSNSKCVGYSGDDVKKAVKDCHVNAPSLAMRATRLCQRANRMST